MNKKWRKTLDVKLLKSDKEKWGLMPIGRISQSFALKDDSERAEIMRFIKDEIKLLEHEIKHTKRWCPRVYHPNAHIAREVEKRTLEIILKRL